MGSASATRLNLTSGEQNSSLTNPETRRLAEEYLLTRPGSGEILWDTLARGLKGAFSNTGSAVSGSLGIAFSAAGFENVGLALQDIADGAQMEARNSTDRRLDGTVAATVAEGVGELAVYSLTGSAVAGLSRAAGAGEKGIALATTLATGSLGGADNAYTLYQDAKAAGASEENARLAAGWGFVAGTATAIPVTRWALKVERGEGTFIPLSLMAWEAVEAGSQNALLEVGNNAIAQKIYDENRHLMEGAVGAFALGAGTGSILSFLSSVVGNGRARVKGDGIRPMSGDIHNAEGDSSAIPSVNSFEDKLGLTNFESALYSGVDGQRVSKLLQSRPVSGTADPRIDSVWRQGYERSLEDGRRAAAALGVRFTTLPVNERRLVFVDHGRDGSIELSIHPNAFETFWKIAASRPEVFKNLISGVLSEEIIHAADLASQRDDWLKIPPSKRGSFTSYVDLDRLALFSEIKQSRATATKENRAIIDGALVDAYRIYFEGKDDSPIIRDAEKVLSLLENVHSRNVNHFQFAAEFVRMLAQVEMRGETTEMGLARLLQRVRAWVDRAISHQKEFRFRKVWRDGAPTPKTPRSDFSTHQRCRSAIFRI